MPRGGGGKFKSGGGVGSLFIRINGSFTLKAVKFSGYKKKFQKLHRIRMRNSTIDERI